MIALVGQTVRDEIVHADGSEEVRCGGAPVFAATALRREGIDAVVVTRGAAPELRGELAAAGLPVVHGPATGTFASRLGLRAGGERDHEIAALGEPFAAEDAATWAAEALASATTVVVGTQWRGDVPPEALRAFKGGCRRLVVDAQGLARPGLGAVRPVGPLDPAWLGGADAVKLSDEEAVALLGGLDAAAMSRAGCGVVLVTRGEDGALVWTPELVDPVAVPAERVAGLADTIGAGDMTTALFAAALDRGEDPVAAARSAAKGVSEVLRGRR